MFRTTLRLGRLWGIDILIDVSWFIIFSLLTYQLATDFFPRQLGYRAFSRSPELVWGLAILASLLLFASVLAHELAHSYMALQRGIPVLSITLFIFGGVAQIADEPDKPMTEFLVAIMGPLLSGVLAIFFAVFWVWPNALTLIAPSLRPLLQPIAAMGYYLALTNASLAVFNLAPGFPLDGGRILRAILWGASKDLRTATRWAAYAGRALAVVLLVGGVVYTLFAQNVSGVWFMLIGWFVWNAAGEANRQVVLREALKQVTAGQIMNQRMVPVPSEISLVQFIEQYALPQRDVVFAVQDSTGPVGLIATESLRRVPRARWGTTTVRALMTPLSALDALKPGDTALTAFRCLNRRDAVELPVVDAAGAIVGLVGREDLARYIQLKFVSER
jgi:Zn-dependent protease